MSDEAIELTVEECGLVAGGDGGSTIGSGNNTPTEERGGTYVMGGG
ncbi:MAG TPA: hypothetical protein VNT25_00875 [Allosphingosinicella sp.]|nr:hypothetical protein [Allosphingosinicella sp.]